MKTQIIENIKTQAEKNRNQFLTSLSGKNTVSELKNDWHIKQYITPAHNAKKYDAEQLKAVIIARYDKLKAKETEEEITEINNIFTSGEITEINISIEWKKSATWGANPTAEATIRGDKWENFSSGSISGCGYDKESTAFAHALNQSFAFRKLIYTNSEKLNGIYGWRGCTLSGGVGVSCYYRIFEAMGYKMTNVGSGKKFDVYHIVKNS